VGIDKEIKKTAAKIISCVVNFWHTNRSKTLGADAKVKKLKSIYGELVAVRHEAGLALLIHMIKKEIILCNQSPISERTFVIDTSCEHAVCD
jgi:hypothetical protein